MKRTHVSSFTVCSMALDWLFLYETFPVMAGQWGYCNKHIALNVKEYINLIQGLLNWTISFESFPKMSCTLLVLTLFIFNIKFCKYPSIEWLDFKLMVLDSHINSALHYMINTLCLFLYLNLVQHQTLPCSVMEMLMFVFLNKIIWHFTPQCLTESIQ